MTPGWAGGQNKIQNLFRAPDNPWLFFSDHGINTPLIRQVKYSHPEILSLNHDYETDTSKSTPS